MYSLIEVILWSKPRGRERRGGSCRQDDVQKPKPCPMSRMKNQVSNKDMDIGLMKQKKKEEEEEEEEHQRPRTNARPLRIQKNINPLYMLVGTMTKKTLMTLRPLYRALDKYIKLRVVPS